MVGQGLQAGAPQPQAQGLTPIQGAGQLADAGGAVQVAQAAGELAAEPLCPYPPGIPLLIPGERIDADRAAWLMQQQRLWPGQIADTVSVVAT
ncbi:MAG: hypothetical protein ACKOCA_01450 [Vulcanococcus sp.]